MFLFVISDTTIKEDNTNASDQTYMAQCLAGTCFPLTANRYNLTKKRDIEIMALSSYDAASTNEILCLDSNESNSRRSLSKEKLFVRKIPMAIFAKQNIYVSSI